MQHGHAQHIAHGDFAEGDGGDRAEQHADTGAGNIGKINHGADHDAVYDRGHGGGDPRFRAQAAHQNRGDQRGQRSDYDIIPHAAADQIGDQAADKQTGHGEIRRRGQQHQRFRYAELNCAEAERLEYEGQQDVHCRHRGGARNARRGKFHVCSFPVCAKKRYGHNSSPYRLRRLTNAATAKIFTF